MTSHEQFKEYKIQIGNHDLIESKVRSHNSTDSKKADNKLREVLKETRVRIGTLLKTDNVSFLFGAGASIDAGGFSLASIPKSLERSLIAKFKSPSCGVTPPWIFLFYETVSALTGNDFTYSDRDNKFINNEEKDVPAIPINLEEYLSHLHMWHSAIGKIGSSILLKHVNGTEISLNKNCISSLINEITSSLSSLLDLPVKEKKDQLSTHRKFIKKILTRPLNLRRVNIFTLNYDTLIEQGADAEGAVLVDGFIGTLRRVFRPESYDLDFYFPAQTTEGHVHRFDRALHLYKLHGSISWHRTCQGWENPYGLYATYFNQECNDHDVLIYPSPLKYGQALDLPYSELFRRFGNSITQPQSILFVIGYGFGDEHVNALIRQALAIPSFTLVVVDPDPRNDFVKKLRELEDERIWIISGTDLGTFKNFVHKLLPDLREEEIDARVIKTFSTLSSMGETRKQQGVSVDDE